MDNKLDEQMDEVNRVTLQYLKDHPLDFDGYLRYVMSDDWKPRDPFTYGGKK